ncbi:MAG: hypothetical protein Q9226_003670 [Calogaya cf. arnoldii]
MQKLWARVAQSPCSCTCSSCFSSAQNTSRGAVARRTATAPARRRLGADPFLAFFCSTVAFAAAVTDGTRKDAKYKEWSSVIRDARRELDSMKADQRRRISHLANTAHREPGAPEDQSWAEVFNWGEREILDRRALGLQDWQGIPLEVLKGASQDEIQHLIDKCKHHWAKFKGSRGSDVWSTVTWQYHIKKIRTAEWAVVHLALDLISHVPDGRPSSLPNDQGTAEEVLSRLSVATTNEIASRRDHIKILLRELSRHKYHDEFYHKFESPRWPQYSLDYVDDTNTPDRLDAKLHSLFDHTTDPTSDNITRLLPRICYYLLTSNTPPTIHTYNLLISEFAGARRDDLIHYLICCMSRTHMRPNEITLAESLRHYVRTNDQFRFDRHVQRMDGFDEGIGEAHPSLDIPRILKFQYRVRVVRFILGKPVDKYYDLTGLDRSDVLALKEEARVKVYEKPRRNLEVYQALIQGALKFHGMSEAIKHYRTMISEGWEPDQEILLSILHRCRKDREWEAGIAVWRRLQTLDESIDERGFVLMLQLCQDCNRHEHFQEILLNGIAHGVLPPTVLEMGWQSAVTRPDANDTIQTVSEAKNMSILKERLRLLLQKSQAGFPGLHDESNHMQLIANEIERSLHRPNLDTIALLHKARLHVATNQRFHQLDKLLRDSYGQILGLLGELDAIRWSIDLESLEARVLCKLSTITHWLEESKDVLSSLRVKQLEDRFAGIKLSIQKSTTKMICIKTRIISDHVNYGLLIQIKRIQFEIAPYMVGYLVPFVKSLRDRFALLRAKMNKHINDTSSHMQNIWPIIYRVKHCIEDHSGDRPPKAIFQPPRTDGTTKGSDSATGVAFIRLGIPTSKPSQVEHPKARKQRRDLRIVRYPSRVPEYKPLLRASKNLDKGKETGFHPSRTDRTTKGRNSVTGIAYISLGISTSKAPSDVEVVKLESPKTRNVDKTQEQVQVQVQVQTRQEPDSEQRRDRQVGRTPFMLKQRLTITDLEMGIKADQGWRQPPRRIDLISSAPDLVLVRELEHG